MRQMKRKISIILSIFFAISTLCANQTNKEFTRTVDSSWEHAKTQYSPPILANGDIGLLIDYRNCQFQETPSYKNIKCTGGKYYPANYRAGRRTDSHKLATFGYFVESVNLAEEKNVSPEKWSQHLDVFNATSEVSNTYNNGKTTINSTAFVSAKHPVIAVQKRFSGEPLKSYTFEYFFSDVGEKQSKPLHMTYEIVGNEIKFFLEKAHKSVNGTIKIICDNKNAKLESTKNSIKITIDNPKNDTAFFIVMVDDFQKNKPEKQLVNIEKEIGKGWSNFFASHKAQWKKFYGDFGVWLEDKTIEATYYTSLYNLKCWSSRWSIPVGFLPMHWDGKYFGFTFFNPALCATNKIEEANKIARFWNSFPKVVKFRAGRPQSPTGRRYSWLTLEDGNEGTTLQGRWLDHILHMGSISLEAMTCYRYTEDKEFLAKTIYPILKGCAEFYEHHAVYKYESGRTVIGKCCDLERLHSPVENAMLTTSAAICTFESASEASKILGVDDEMAVRWKQLANDLRKYLPKDNKKYIAYADAKEMSVGVLGGIIPYGAVDENDKFQRNAIYDFEKNGLHVGNMYKIGTRICSWYAAWLSCAMARIGDGEGAKRNLKSSTDSIGKFAEIFEINEPNVMSIPWCSSPQGTYVQALNEMFVQCKGDAILILPAVSKEWKNYSFKLRAYDNIIVECKCVDGKPTIKLTAENNHSERAKTIIVAGGTPQRIKLSKGETKTL